MKIRYRNKKMRHEGLHSLNASSFSRTFITEKKQKKILINFEVFLLRFKVLGCFFFYFQQNYLKIIEQFFYIETQGYIF